MGIYLNPGAKKLQKALNSEIYIDKSGIIGYLNRVVDTEQCFVCVSRPRRFGKSMAANLISAYYDRTVDAKYLFQNMKIASEPEFTRYAGQYDVIKLNIQEFLSNSRDMGEMLALIRKSLLWDLLEAYPDFRYFDQTNLSRTLMDIYRNTQRQVVIIIDEWDCVFREEKNHKQEQEAYLDFLRDLLKDKEYVALTYMTGILPIKKIWYAFGFEYVFRVFHAGPGGFSRVYWF